MFRKRSYSLIVVGLLFVMTMALLLYGSRLFTDIEEEAHITQENRIVVGAVSYTHLTLPTNSRV